MKACNMYIVPAVSIRKFITVLEQIGSYLCSLTKTQITYRISGLVDGHTNRITQKPRTVNPRLSATRLSANFGHPPQIYRDILL